MRSPPPRPRKLILDSSATWIIRGLLLEFCLRIQDEWLPHHLRSTKPRMCALYERLQANEIDLEIDLQDLETLREACRFVVAELGPDELSIIHSITPEDAAELDAALERLARGR